MKDILFVCIGNGNIVGDSLGPLVGSFLKIYEKTNKNIEVLGTIDNSIGYKKLGKDLENIIREKKDRYIIVIDSALGEEKNIGKIMISKNRLYAGSGVNRAKVLKGDIVIRGIVGKNHNNIKLNIKELEKINQSKIEEIACKIIFEIILILESEHCFLL